MNRSRFTRALGLFGATAALALVAAAPAVAGTASTTFAVTANVSQACAATANPMNFASVGTTSSTSGFAGEASTTTIAVQCNAAFPVSVALTPGALTIGGQPVTYNLYQDSAHTLPWGTGTSAESITGTDGTQTLTVYGELPAQADIPAGTGSGVTNVALSF
ncbi:MAG TPA: spore coat protein U domain-containing protein [Dyella sp.]|uniref:spore coat protein U domain-containing protein n=1 Tax=Dyella sp. TaxID=1869338 RepID=UPI002B5576CB|nr:spore coat protein U domain-containing protein [Dyella sp.]HTV84227.1 spore coat protein U domain-containing protein [Dyella sp.]